MPRATTSSFPTPLGPGKSTKPSDGLRTKFPRYNYDDMVDAQYRLVTEHLGVQHLRARDRQLDGRHADVDLGARSIPDFMDIAVPMASLPTEMSGRNWMMRRLIIDSIRNDPEWMNGNYTKQPRSAQFASVFFGDRHQRRQPGAVQGGADAREGRPAARPAPGRAVHRPTPTTCCTSGIRRATTTRRRAWSASRRRCSRSTPPTTSAIRRSSACSIARSSA